MLFLQKKSSLFNVATLVGMVALGLVGCSKPEQKPTENTESKPAEASQTNTATPAPTSGKTITVYSSRNEQLIKPLLDKFTQETGINVNLVTDKPGPLAERLTAEGDNSPADLLITVDAGNLWQAKQKGLLQVGLNTETINKNIPEQFRDKEGYWAGLSLRARTIFYQPSSVKAEELSTYEDLADPKWKGKLCLRTSNNVYNQSLVASMIATLGAEKTEQVLKGWVANLATNPFSDDTKLLEAIAAGQCQVGIANSYYYGRLVEKKADFPVKIFWANQGSTGTHVNVSGAGITKSAKNVEEAKKLVEWLSAPEAQGLYSSDNKEYPANPAGAVSDLLKSWGEFKQDSINVAKFGELQSEAVKLMDKAGYK